jgi:hypothetical protein
MRKAETEEELMRISLQYLNYLFGRSESSTIFWSLFLKLQLLGKFAAYNVTIWTAEESKDLSRYVSKSALLLEIISKSVSLSHSFSFVLFDACAFGAF